MAMLALGVGNTLLRRLALDFIPAAGVLIVMDIGSGDLETVPRLLRGDSHRLQTLRQARVECRLKIVGVALQVALCQPSSALPHHRRKLKA